MGVCEIRRAAMLPEWQQQICECRSSGQPVTKWCEEHHISVKTYYRWERLCLAMAANKDTGYTERAGFIKIDPATLPTVQEEPTRIHNIVINSGNVRIELPPEIDMEQLAQLVGALNRHA